MSQDPNNLAGSYAINTSSLPVYVLPPQLGTVQGGYPTPPPVYSTVPPGYAPAQGFDQTMYHPGAPMFVPAQPEPASFYSTPPPQYTQTIQDPAEKLEASILERATNAPRICGSISEAFSLLGKHCCYYTPAMFLFMFLFVGVTTSMLYLSFYQGANPTWLLLLNMILSVLSPPILGGIFYATLQALRSDAQPMQFSHFLFCFTPQIWFSLVILRFLSGVIIAVGFLCLFVPGVYFSIAFLLSELLYIEYHKTPGFTFVRALSLSRVVVTRHWCAWFGLAIVAALVSLIPFCWPVGVICLVVAFRDTVGFLDHHDPNAFALNSNL